MIIEAFIFAVAIACILSCTNQVQVPDVPWTASLGNQGAVRFNTLSVGQTTMTYAQFLTEWDDLLNTQGPMICTRTSFFSALKALQEKLCNQSNNCQYMTPIESSQFTGFMQKLDSAQKRQSLLMK